MKAAALLDRCVASSSRSQSSNSKRVYQPACKKAAVAPGKSKTDSIVASGRKNIKAKGPARPDRVDRADRVE